MSSFYKNVLFVLLIASSFTFQTGCRSTPITGRKQMILIPESQEISMGVQSYQTLMKDEKLSQNRKAVEMVQRVGKRIAAAAGRDDYQWEFNLIDSPTMNAFALPGGKVAIYEGILPVCENEAGLAVVMSHEIAHALARHGGERMSQTGVVSTLGKVISVSSSEWKQEDQAKLMSVYGTASQYGFALPFSRKHESEADHIGLILMAKAGYDPREAPRFWERFSKAGGDKPPEFMSTHPSDETRASDLRGLLPVAMENYDVAPQQYALGSTIPPINQSGRPSLDAILPASMKTSKKSSAAIHSLHHGHSN